MHDEFDEDTGQVQAVSAPDDRDEQRAMALVLRDHARACWGELRGIDQLDSHKAEQALMAHMEKLLIAARRNKSESQSSKINRLLEMGKKLRHALMLVWGDTGKNGDAQLHSQKSCRLCGGTKKLHAPKCPIKVALTAAKNAGIGNG